MQRSSTVDLSVVIPVYGCACTLGELHRRLTAAVSGLVPSYEIMFVDDRGPDQPWPLLEEMAARDPSVVAIRTSRNVGQQLAIAIGLRECRGDHAVVMDCDLQDPPEAIAALLGQDAFDIVLGKRKGQHQSRWRTIANRVYVGLLSILSWQRYDGELGSFSLVSRQTITRFLALPQRGGPLPLILLRLRLPTAIIEIERQARPVGQSSFGAFRLLSYGLRGLIFATAGGLLPQYDLAGLVERRVDACNRLEADFESTLADA
jgi:glycosyltransferase involved in cell wall biosynthesis